MAIIHRATLTPTKLELIEAWLPATPAEPGPLRQVGAYRFDDPDGEVGIEALLVTRGGPVLHVALTYRGAPLPDGRAALIGTMEHSVLGRRWVYDGATDPVALAAYRRALAGRQEQASLEVWDGDTRVGTRERTVQLSVRNPAAAPEAPVARLCREVGPGEDGTTALVATWSDGTGVVATV